ncbi:hypothetical protein [Nocardia sp. N2S4-5]|uniref:hypothetical protein n=1 Tax=Nocardia sp. N2S4-5 TaxID=3351565 RepID=UPI0037CDC096
MKFRASTAAGAMVIGAMTVAAGAAHGEPALTGAEYIDYATRVVDRTIVTTLKGGTFELADRSAADGRQVLELKNRTGQVALEMPLNFRVAGVPVPVRSVVKEDGRVLELTPDQPAEVDREHPLTAVRPIASPLENDRAINDFATKLALSGGIGTAIGTVLGIAVGTVLGVPIGGAIGCAVDVATGCVPGLLIGAVAGGIVGALAVGIIGAAIGGGPTVSTAGVEMLNTLQAPPGTTPWADLAQPPASPVQPAPAPPQPAPAKP